MFQDYRNWLAEQPLVKASRKGQTSMANTDQNMDWLHPSHRQRIQHKLAADLGVSVEWIDDTGWDLSADEQRRTGEFVVGGTLLLRLGQVFGLMSDRPLGAPGGFHYGVDAPGKFTWKPDFDPNNFMPITWIPDPIVSLDKVMQPSEYTDAQKARLIAKFAALVEQL